MPKNREFTDFALARETATGVVQIARSSSAELFRYNEFDSAQGIAQWPIYDHREAGIIPPIDMLVIPAHLDFADLALQREPVTNNILFAAGKLAELCRGTGLDPDGILEDEDLSCWIICQWYIAHISAGGEPDPVADRLLVELAEGAHPGAEPEPRQ